LRYLSWAAFYEGPSDALYLDVLLPRLIRELIATDGLVLADIPDSPAVRLGEKGRDVVSIAGEACKSRDAFNLVFIHADTGGRGLERDLHHRSDAYCVAMSNLCGLPRDHCVSLTPKHETEAWLLADREAVAAALGVRGRINALGLPVDAAAAERIEDPKAVLANTIALVAGRRRGQRVDTLFPAIAQRQDFARLRRSQSFKAFEERLRSSLRVLGFIA
jgi:hypothetical protein